MIVVVYACPARCAGCGARVDEHDDEQCWHVDRFFCPYFQKQLGTPGFEDGICGFGCQEEPACVTEGVETWPPERLDEAMGAPVMLVEIGVETW